MLYRQIKHANRYQEIIRAFLRNGFGYIVKEIGLAHAMPMPKKRGKTDSDSHPKTTGERIRSFLQELGPTFVKIGQIASTRRDIFPEDIVKELEKLQDNVQPFSFEEARGIIEEELGETIENIFAEFDETPLAAASIGQVHYAVLPSQQAVAVKIQRPNIRSVIETDLEILQDLARMMESRMDWARKYKIGDMVEEFSKSLRDELDFSIEARNAEKIAAQFTEDSTIRIPSIHWDYSTKKVLTMEYIQGIKVNDVEQLEQQGYNRKIVAERLAHSIFHQILIEGFFHGDPHPGNVSVLPGEVIVLMDFGMVGRLNPEMKYHFASLVISLRRGSSKGIIQAISRMGLIRANTDMVRLRSEVDELRDKYYGIPFSKMSLGEAINDLFIVAGHHGIIIPADLTLVGKAILTVEGVVALLDPEFSIVDVAQPFGQRLLQDRMNPKHLAGNLWNFVGEYTEFLTNWPKSMKELSSIIQHGKVRIEITMPELHLLLRRLDKISNRLSFSIVLLSFSIIMVGLIIASSIGRQSSFLWHIPTIELGFAVAFLMFIWLLYSIYKSGRF